MVDPNPDENLTQEEKQKIFEEARAPVNLIYKELEEIRQRLNEEKFTGEECDLNEKHKEIYNKWKVAMKNAAKDIFERINSKGIKNILVDRKEVFCVDFHGLFVDEAKEVFSEFILPLLDVAKQIMIITGRGMHSQSGKSILKEAILEYLTFMNIKFKPVANNEGVIYIFSDHF